MYICRELRLREAYEFLAKIFQQKGQEVSWAHPLEIILKTLGLLPNVSLLQLGHLDIPGWFIEGVNALPDLQTIQLGLPLYYSFANYARKNPRSLRKIQCFELILCHHPFLQPAEREDMACISAGMRTNQLVIHPTPSISEHLKTQQWAAIEDIEFVLDTAHIHPGTLEWLHIYMNTRLQKSITSVTFSAGSGLRGFSGVVGAEDILPLPAILCSDVGLTASIRSYTIAPVSDLDEQSGGVSQDSVWRGWKVVRIHVAAYSHMENGLPFWIQRAPYLETLNLGDTQVAGHVGFELPGHQVSDAAVAFS